MECTEVRGTGWGAVVRGTGTEVPAVRVGPVQAGAECRPPKVCGGGGGDGGLGEWAGEHTRSVPAFVPRHRVD